MERALLPQPPATNQHLAGLPRTTQVPVRMVEGDSTHYGWTAMLHHPALTNLAAFVSGNGAMTACRAARAIDMAWLAHGVTSVAPRLIGQSARWRQRAANSGAPSHSRPSLTLRAMGSPTHFETAAYGKYRPQQRSGGEGRSDRSWHRADRPLLNHPQSGNRRLLFVRQDVRQAETPHQRSHSLEATVQVTHQRSVLACLTAEPTTLILSTGGVSLPHSLIMAKSLSDLSYAAAKDGYNDY